MRRRNAIFSLGFLKAGNRKYLMQCQALDNYTQYELYGTPLKMGHLVRIVEISAKMRDMISWREKIMENLKKYENEKGNRT